MKEKVLLALVPILGIADVPNNEMKNSLPPYTFSFDVGLLCSKIHLDDQIYAIAISKDLQSDRIYYEEFEPSFGFYLQAGFLLDECYYLNGRFDWLSSTVESATNLQKIEMSSITNDKALIGRYLYSPRAKLYDARRQDDTSNSLDSNSVRTDIRGFNNFSRKDSVDYYSVSLQTGRMATLSCDFFINPHWGVQFSQSTRSLEERGIGIVTDTRGTSEEIGAEEKNFKITEGSLLCLDKSSFLGAGLVMGIDSSYRVCRSILVFGNTCIAMLVGDHTLEKCYVVGENDDVTKAADIDGDMENIYFNIPEVTVVGISPSIDGAIGLEFLSGNILSDSISFRVGMHASAHWNRFYQIDARVNTYRRGTAFSCDIIGSGLFSTLGFLAELGATI